MTPGRAVRLPEPTGELLGPIAVNDVDLMIVPAAAVDRGGMRLGWGRGYFDKTIGSMLHCPPVYAVVYDTEYLDEVPRDVHDQPVTASSRRPARSTSPPLPLTKDDPMPTYAYACKQCGHRFEAVQSFSDAALTTCPECGGPLRKEYGSIGVTFNGSGFYRTDSRTAPASSVLRSGGDGGSSSTSSAPAKTETKAPASSGSGASA